MGDLKWWILLSISVAQAAYEPTWESLDTRPLPPWYDEAKFGIFLHWGVFSVPGFGNEWFWKNWKDSNENGSYAKFMRENYPPNFTYQDFGRDFTAEFFDPQRWANIFQAAGAQYVVLTSKHHEGYTLWPSKFSFSWNSVDVGPHRDLVGELAEAVKKSKIKFGLYHSMFEWYHPLWLQDSGNNFSTKDFSLGKILPELKELVQLYEPEVIWSDGEWLAPDWYWNSTDFLSWLYNDSPVKDTVVTNDRWGSTTRCKHGDFFTCADHYNPGVLQKHKWENAMTIDKHSWGYRRNMKLADVRSFKELVWELVSTVSCGGNLLLNIGPTKEGTISPIFEERLTQLGAWLKVTGEGIYGSKPWTFQNETVQTGVWYTQRDQHVYAFTLTRPENQTLTLHRPIATKASEVTMLGYGGKIKWAQNGDGSITTRLPSISEAVVPWPWVLKLSKIKN